MTSMPDRRPLIRRRRGRLSLEFTPGEVQSQMDPADPDALVLVEWGEKFPSIVARADGEIAIEHAGGDERMFEVRVR